MRIKLLKLPLTIAMTFAAMSAQAEPDRPNILFILMDDMGWTDAGCLGSDYYETPNIDRLARDGMLLTNAYVNAPVCTPSRACIISGQTCPRHGIYIVSPDKAKTEDWIRYQSSLAQRTLVPVENNKILPETVVGLPVALKSAGYVTGFTGKWHHRPDPTTVGFDQHLRMKRLKSDPKGIFELTRLTIQFLRDHRNESFFFYLSHHAPHVRVEAREATIARFRRKPKGTIHDNPEYAAMMADADKGIGMVLDELDALGLADRTMVVFFSDNGGFLRETSVTPLRGGKGQFYEGGIRVPMIVRWPGVVTPGSVCREPVIGTDLYPTFLDIATAPRPPNHNLDGVSLVPLLRATDDLDRKAIFWHQPAYTFGFDQSPCSVVRAGNYKLIEFFESQSVELYKLSDDMGETANLADDMPDKTEELQKLLDDWRSIVKAPFPELREKRSPRQSPGRGVHE